MKPTHIRLAMATVGLAAIAFATLAELTPRIVWNGSASMARGLYRIDSGPVQTGDLVLTRMPEWADNLAWERGYYPPDIPLLKRIVAADGDRICSFGPQIFVNDEPVATAQIADSLGHEMPSWSGCRVLDADKILLINAHSGSFDGRYFGATDRSLVMGRAVPLWTYR
ncbi:S26 family signal peptidase [Parasphingopyxis algicola]|uniref:S26 family signal peptidase n=1 Tax=Parasphingopyxis algicola TaxID=2026624 RepID=UPI0015A1D70E|nr:S26 family signal peptidase [Parasphingopyxis algicola]QLC24876.1 S26 family signal peptidase [Parasphingopyxis algicola]